MANATLITEVTKKQVTKYLGDQELGSIDTEILKQIVGVQLDLSLEEARTLQTILANVGGCDKTSKRRFTDRIYYTLNSQGIQRFDGITEGTIYFKDEMS